jgi:tetratricopeptide (TPR) repeat protein
MLLYFSLASRLAPLLLMVSAQLVGTRWLHDLRPLRARRLNGIAAAVYMLGGLAFVLPFALRMGLMVGIRMAVEGDDFPLAAARLQQYQLFGGKLEGNLLFARGLAHAKQGEVTEAVPDFLAAARSNDPLVSPETSSFYAAICFLALNRDDDAERIFIALPESVHDGPVRDYCLGRIAERQNRPGAEEWFRRSLALNPGFTPALYRLLRLLSSRHDVQGADAVVETFRRSNPSERHAPYLDSLLMAIHRGDVLADYEPFRLPIQPPG